MVAQAVTAVAPAAAIVEAAVPVVPVLDVVAQAA